MKRIALKLPLTEEKWIPLDPSLEEHFEDFTYQDILEVRVMLLDEFAISPIRRKAQNGDVVAESFLRLFEGQRNQLCLRKNRNSNGLEFGPGDRGWLINNTIRPVTLP